MRSQDFDHLLNEFANYKLQAQSFADVGDTSNRIYYQSLADERKSKILSEITDLCKERDYYKASDKKQKDQSADYHSWNE